MNQCRKASNIQILNQIIYLENENFEYEVDGGKGSSAIKQYKTNTIKQFQEDSS